MSWRGSGRWQSAFCSCVRSLLAAAQPPQQHCLSSRGSELADTPLLWQCLGLQPIVWKCWCFSAEQQGFISFFLFSVDKTTLFSMSSPCETPDVFQMISPPKCRQRQMLAWKISAPLAEFWQQQLKTQCPVMESG